MTSIRSVGDCGLFRTTGLAFVPESAAFCSAGIDLVRHFTTESRDGGPDQVAKFRVIGRLEDVLIYR